MSRWDQLSAKGHCERRYLFSDTELRVEESDGVARIVGHAAVFNESVEIMHQFFETILPGAFAKTIKDADVRGLFNHDPNYVLGRNRARPVPTLELEEDSRGLLYRITPPQSDLIQDLVIAPMKRGDISGSSFSFDVIRQERTTNSDDETVRVLKEVRLWDVGPVTFPAYPGTSAEVRSMLAECGTLAELDWITAFRGGGLTSPEIRANNVIGKGSSIEKESDDGEVPFQIQADSRDREIQLMELEA